MIIDGSEMTVRDAIRYAGRIANEMQFAEHSDPQEAFREIELLLASVGRAIDANKDLRVACSRT